MTLNEEAFALGALLDEVMPMLERRARDAEVELVRVPGLEVLQVHADQRRVRQAVINLIDNAVKFTPAGGRVVVSQGDDAEGRARIPGTANGLGMSPPPENRKTAGRRTGGQEGENWG